MASMWGVTPGQSIRGECARRGEAQVVAGCMALLAGQPVDEALVAALGGPSAYHVWVTPQLEYWRRVWGARGLLYAWDERAVPAVIDATRDESWRVREMAAKVVARRGVGDAVEDMARLQDDPVPRVRAAAGRALVRLTARGA